MQTFLVVPKVKCNVTPYNRRVILLLPLKKMETLTKHSCLPKSSLVFAKSVEIKLVDREEIYFSTLQPSNLSLSQIFHCSLSFEMCVEIDKHWI